MKISKTSIFFSTFMVIAFLLTAVTPAAAIPAETVRIWVSYQNGRQAEVLQSLKNANASVHYDFPQLEAYVVSLPTAALNGILNNPFVLGIDTDPARYPVETVQAEPNALYEDTVDVNGQIIPWGIDAVQARDVWDANRDAVVDPGAPSGEGLKVCIIDTGYYADHEDLLDIEDGVTGMSQVDDDWARDGYGHGTHVAGTIAALNNELGVVGVTPGAVSLHIVKIFDDTGAWVSKAHASDLVAAIYSCQEAGANVISMSLSGTSSNKMEESAFNQLYEDGILHVAAASNDHVEGEEIDPYHYPASYDSVISVAAVDSNLNIADFSQRNDKVELAAPGVGVLSTIPYVDSTTVTVDGVIYNGFLVEYASRNSASGALVDGGRCLAQDPSWAGKVVLCERGDISFFDKVMAVQNSGGVGAVIYNNVEGDLYATLGEGNTSDIIAIGVTQATGQYLIAEKLGFIAVLDSIYSWPASGYEAWGGTSMATPHVAGVAALIWSANLNFTNVQIREALVETAVDLGDEGRDVLFGYGFVQAAEALTYLEGLTPPVAPELSVEILSPDHVTHYEDKDAVLIKALVTDGEGPVQGANVTATVTGTQGQPKVFRGVTGLDGMIEFIYRINVKKGGKGQYIVEILAEKEGFFSGSASTIFTVQ